MCMLYIYIYICRYVGACTYTSIHGSGDMKIHECLTLLTIKLCRDKFIFRKLQLNK